MALVDLITDLSNFKWTQYDSVETPVNNIPDDGATGFTKFMQDTQFVDIDVPNKSSNIIPTAGGYTWKGPMNIIPDTDATGFTLDMKLYDTQFIGIGSQESNIIPTAGGYTWKGPMNIISDIDATGFTLDMKLHDTQFIGIGSQESNIIPIGGNYTWPGPMNIISDTDATGFTLGMKLYDTQFIGISDESFTPPLFNTPAGTTDITEFTEDFNTSQLKDRTSDIKAEYTKFPYRNNDVMGFDQPFIIRDIGDEWGLDTIETDNPLGSIMGGAANLIDSFIGGFVRGAPGFSGLVSRNIHDKIRLGKFLLTPNGIGFLGKQFALQAVNPTLETKIYNPASVLGIDLQDMQKIFSSGKFDSAAAGRTLAKFALPISHIDRQWGSGKYSDVVPTKGIPSTMLDQMPDLVASSLQKIKFDDPDGRLQFQSTVEIGPIELDLYERLLLINPNKYLFPISSAPKSVVDGKPSFTGHTELAAVDADKIENTRGGTFNKKSNLIDRYSALAYGHLNGNKKYTKNLLSPSEQNCFDEKNYGANSNRNKINMDDIIDDGGLMDVRNRANKIVNKIGDPGNYKFSHKIDKQLGIIKKNFDGKYITDATDRINLIPYGSPDESLGTMSDKDDFIPFKFKDVVNGKWLIFRAILSDIADSISPEWSEEKYIGRPDKVHVYQGTSREIEFTFKIFPKTKQELPVLWEKMNYLVGLCYPSWDDLGGSKNAKMISPFIELTIGNMYTSTPGYLTTLNITVEDNSPWELDEHFQLPKYLSISCGFKYIGKYKLATKGKHFELDWLNGHEGGYGIDFEEYPWRGGSKKKSSIDIRELFKELGQDDTNDDYSYSGGND